MDVVDDYELTNKGLTISRHLLDNVGVGDEIDIITKDHMIIIKPKSMTDRVRGIVKKSNLTVEELDELYHISKGA
ncbi:MAG: hypothetical protein GQ469_08290 [Methanosarcinales archaeon]|jgi:hypothetical protein|nr:hypothetical protein [Methanosarcinales archaeon]